MGVYSERALLLLASGISDREGAFLGRLGLVLYVRYIAFAGGSVWSEHHHYAQEKKRASAIAFRACGPNMALPGSKL